MSPGVDRNFVAFHIFFDKDGRTLNDTRSHDKEGCRDSHIVKISKEFLGCNNLSSVSGDRERVNGL